MEYQNYERYLVKSFRLTLVGYRYLGIFRAFLDP